MNTNMTIDTPMSAAQKLMDNRSAIKALEAQKEALRHEFAAAIMMDAIESPTRITRLDTYWRAYGFLPTDIFAIISDFLQNTTDPDFSAVQVLHHPIQRHYAEFDANGNPTGNTITRREEVALLVNLGEVKPRRNPVEGEQDEEPFMGSASLIADAPLCKENACSYPARAGRDCGEHPAKRWKCYRNSNVIGRLTNKILAQL